jgi:hypothetical protein
VKTKSCGKKETEHETDKQIKRGGNPMFKNGVIIESNSDRRNGRAAVSFYSCTEKNGKQFLFQSRGLTYPEWLYFHNGRSLNELRNYRHRNFRIRKTIEHVLRTYDYVTRECTAEREVIRDRWKCKPEPAYTPEYEF